MRASKSEWANFEKAEDLLWGRDAALTVEQVEFVLDHWRPYVNGRVDKAGAFFTPAGLARTVSWCSGDSGRFVDLCAGIGALTWPLLRDPMWMSRVPREIVAVELNPRFVEVGRRLMPEVAWVCGDVLDQSTWDGLGRFDHAVSNPPFGMVATRGARRNWLRYHGVMEYQVMEVAARVANTVTMIVPQGSAPALWQRSGGADRNMYRWDGRSSTYSAELSRPAESAALLKWYETWPDSEVSGSNFDTADGGDWNGTNVRVEIVHVEFSVSPPGPREEFYADLPLLREAVR